MAPWICRWSVLTNIALCFESASACNKSQVVLQNGFPIVVSSTSLHVALASRDPRVCARWIRWIQEGWRSGAQTGVRNIEMGLRQNYINAEVAHFTGALVASLCFFFCFCLVLGSRLTGGWWRSSPRLRSHDRQDGTERGACRTGPIHARWRQRSDLLSADPHSRTIVILTRVNMLYSELILGVGQEGPGPERALRADPGSGRGPDANSSPTQCSSFCTCFLSNMWLRCSLVISEFQHENFSTISFSERGQATLTSSLILPCRPCVGAPLLCRAASSMFSPKHTERAEDGMRY